MDPNSKQPAQTVNTASGPGQPSTPQPQVTTPPVMQTPPPPTQQNVPSQNTQVSQPPLKSSRNFGKPLAIGFVVIFIAVVVAGAFLYLRKPSTYSVSEENVVSLPQVPKADKIDSGLDEFDTVVKTAETDIDGATSSLNDQPDNL